MSLLSRIFGKGDNGEAAEEPAPCRHVNLVARWDDPADIGKEDKASGYGCVSCNEVFTLEQATAIRGGTPAA